MMKVFAGLLLALLFIAVVSAVNPVYVGGAYGSNSDPTPIETDAGAVFGIRRTYWAVANTASSLNAIKADQAKGRASMVSYKVGEWQAASTGAVDTWAKDLMTSYRGLGLKLPVYIAIHHEPEGDDPMSLWTAMQKRLAPFFNDAAYPLVRFGYITTGYDQFFQPQKATYGLDVIHPYGAPIKFIGIDPYQFYGQDPKFKWTDFLNAYVIPLSTFAKAQNVPEWGLSETGFVDSAYTDNPSGLGHTWIADVINWMSQYGGTFYCYFNTALNSGGNSFPLQPGTDKYKAFTTAVKAGFRGVINVGPTSAPTTKAPTTTTTTKAPTTKAPTTKAPSTTTTTTKSPAATCWTAPAAAGTAYTPTSFKNTQKGDFVFSMDITPGTGAMTYFGLSNGFQTKGPNYAFVGRFFNGKVEATNAKVWASAASVSYTTNVKYTVSFTVNHAAQTYTMTVRPSAGGATMTVGTSYKFQTASAKFTHYGIVDYAANTNTKVCNFLIGGVAASGVAPAEVNGNTHMLVADFVISAADDSFNIDDFCWTVSAEIGVDMKYVKCSQLANEESKRDVQVVARVQVQAADLEAIASTINTSVTTVNGTFDNYFHLNNYQFVSWSYAIASNTDSSMESSESMSMESSDSTAPMTSTTGSMMGSSTTGETSTSTTPAATNAPSTAAPTAGPSSSSTPAATTPAATTPAAATTGMPEKHLDNLVGGASTVVLSIAMMAIVAIAQL